ncbi:MAG: PD-(D/E)XK nuclease family protein [Patescibacteria group bacterium]
MAYKRKVYDAGSSEPFKISRTKVDVFSECQRCSYLDLRLGVSRPSMPSFTLNNAVDELFKREFDIHREAGTVHPILRQYGVEAVPFKDERMDEWRDALRRGIGTHHTPSGFYVRGGIDDVWVRPNGELLIVDYKATSKAEGPNSVDHLYDSYKKQMEVYQWLFKQNGFKVSPVGYFVYANARQDDSINAFDAKLDFDINLIAYTGDDSWVEPLLMEMKEVLSSDTIPPVGTSFGGKPCEHCLYREAAGKAFKELHAGSQKKETVSKKVVSSTKKKKDAHTETLFN